MDAGEIVEFDSPHKLLQMNGHFSKLVSETGIEESRHLHEKAEYYYINRMEIEKFDDIDLTEIDLEDEVAFKGERRKVMKL